MTNKSKISLSGKLVCGCAFLYIGMQLFFSGLSIFVLIGSFALYFIHFNAKYNRDYEIETTGYVYDVTADKTYYVYYDEYDELQYGESNIKTEAASIDSYITVRYDSVDDSFVYIPELMDAYKSFPLMFGLVAFLGLLFALPGLVLLIISIRLIVECYKEYRSKKQIKGVENNG